VAPLLFLAFRKASGAVLKAGTIFRISGPRLARDRRSRGNAMSMRGRGPKGQSRRLIEIGREIRQWAAEERHRNPSATLALNNLAAVIEHKARRMTLTVVSSQENRPVDRGDERTLLRKKGWPVGF